LKYKHVPPFKQNTLPSFSGHSEPDGTQLIGVSVKEDENIINKVEKISDSLLQVSLFLYI
jgi:hypothetical protein